MTLQYLPDPFWSEDIIQGHRRLFIQILPAIDNLSSFTSLTWNDLWLFKAHTFLTSIICHSNAYILNIILMAKFFSFWFLIPENLFVLFLLLNVSLSLEILHEYNLGILVSCELTSYFFDFWNSVIYEMTYASFHFYFNLSYLLFWFVN